MSYTITIPSYENQGGYIEYTIRVKGSVSEGSWTFLNRYSLMRQFHDQLRRTIPNLPNFPPKKFFGNMQEAFVRTRKAALEQYFRTLSALPEVRDNKVFLAFLKPKNLIIELAPQANALQQKVQERPVYKPPVQITKELEQQMTHIVDEAVQRFINLSDLPTPLDAEDVSRKQKDHAKAINSAGFQLTWKLSVPQSEAGASKNVLTNAVKMWNDEKTRDLENALGAADVSASDSVILQFQPS